MRHCTDVLLVHNILLCRISHLWNQPIHIQIEFQQKQRTLPTTHIHRHTAVNMITRFLTSVSTAFSPFNPKSGKTARNFLAMLPPNARTTMAINVKMLPKTEAAKPALLSLTFSAFPFLPRLLT